MARVFFSFGSFVSLILVNIHTTVSQARKEEDTYQV